MTKVSNKFKRMSDVYRIFARHWEHVLSFSDEAMKEMYLFESQGVSITSENNGFEVGKRYLNLTVTMWKQDIKDGILLPEELYLDFLPNGEPIMGIFPYWWLDKILGKNYASK